MGLSFGPSSYCITKGKFRISFETSKKYLKRNFFLRRWFFIWWDNFENFFNKELNNLNDFVIVGSPFLFLFLRTETYITLYLTLEFLLRISTLVGYIFDLRNTLNHIYPTCFIRWIVKKFEFRHFLDSFMGVNFLSFIQVHRARISLLIILSCVTEDIQLGGIENILMASSFVELIGIIY